MDTHVQDIPVNKCVHGWIAKGEYSANQQEQQCVRDWLNLQADQEKKLCKLNGRKDCGE